MKPLESHADVHPVRDVRGHSATQGSRSQRARTKRARREARSSARAKMKATVRADVAPETGSE